MDTSASVTYNATTNAAIAAQADPLARSTFVVSNSPAPNTSQDFSLAFAAVGVAVVSNYNLVLNGPPAVPLGCGDGRRTFVLLCPPPSAVFSGKPLGSSVTRRAFISDRFSTGVQMPYFRCIVSPLSSEYVQMCMHTFFLCVSCHGVRTPPHFDNLTHWHVSMQPMMIEEVI